jgi:Flp pilus assembly pilin Flp
MLELFTALWKDETGQDLAEYALLLAFIAIAVVLTLPLLGSAIRGGSWRQRRFLGRAGEADGSRGLASRCPSQCGEPGSDLCRFRLFSPRS